MHRAWNPVLRFLPPGGVASDLNPVAAVKLVWRIRQLVYLNITTITTTTWAHSDRIFSPLYQNSFSALAVRGKERKLMSA